MSSISLGVCITNITCGIPHMNQKSSLCKALGPLMVLELNKLLLSFMSNNCPTLSMLWKRLLYFQAVDCLWLNTVLVIRIPK